jgi:hypothetical protein
MAEKYYIPDESGEAGEDLDDYQYYLVGLNSSGDVVLADGTESVVMGPLQNKPKSGEAASYRIIGKSKVKYGGSVTVGAKLKASSGKAIATTTNTDWFVGIATKAGSTNEIGEMICTRGYVSA